MAATHGRQPRAAGRLRFHSDGANDFIETIDFRIFARVERMISIGFRCSIMRMPTSV